MKDEVVLLFKKLRLSCSKMRKKHLKRSKIMALKSR